MFTLDSTTIELYINKVNKQFDWILVFFKVKDVTLRRQICVKFESANLQVLSLLLVISKVLGNTSIEHLQKE